MKGYYKNDEATQNVFTEDGWLRTGDLGTIDHDNRIFIRGRSKTMILGASGQNIYPEEIESKLNNLPFVMESLVVERNGKSGWCIRITIRWIVRVSRIRIFQLSWNKIG